MSSAIRPGLCLFLTIWAASTRSLPARNESPNSLAWWEQSDFPRLRFQANEARKKGDLAGAETAFQAGYNLARRQGIPAAEVSYLTALGNIRFLRFEYQDA